MQRYLLLLCLALGAAMNAQAHTLDQLEEDLSKREQYFQPVDRPAPPFALHDAAGESRSLENWRGKVVVLWFIYASCPDVCPLHTEKLAAVQQMINRTLMKDLVAFVAITTDPQRDVGDVLRNYGEVHGLDPANSFVLTSGPENPATTRELAEQYGLKFTASPDGMLMHGVVTHVIDKSGNLRARYHGLQFAPANLIAYVNALTNDYH